MAADIDIVFTRGLPKNLVELSTVITNLQGIAPNEQLLQLLPFVTNVQDTLKMLDAENVKNAKNKKNNFGMVDNTPPADGEGNEE